MSRVKIRELTEAENFDPDADYVAIAQGNPVATRKLKVSEIAGGGVDFVANTTKFSENPGTLPITGQNNTNYALHVTFGCEPDRNNAITAEISEDGTTWKTVNSFKKNGGAGYGRWHRGVFWVPEEWRYQITGSGEVRDLIETYIGVESTSSNQSGAPLPRDPMPGTTDGDESSGGQGTHDKIFDLTNFGIPENPYLRWGIFTSTVEGTFTDVTVTTYTDTNWTTGNVAVQCANPDKYNHKFIQQFFAPILNNKHCYIRVASPAATAQWSLNFIGVV